jgi:glucoamylase
MRFSSSLFGVVSLLCSPGVATTLRGRDLDSFIATEKTIALQGVLNNIGPDGSQVKGAGNYIIASPSKEDPDCEYSPY